MLNCVEQYVPLSMNLPALSYPDFITMNDADVQVEKQKLIDLLKIPISSLSYSRFYCELFLDQQSIGFLSISLTPSGIQYETHKEALQKLNWSKVYSFHQKELNEKIEKLILLHSFRAIPIAFRRLYIEDEKDQLIASMECTFENQLWNVQDEKILAPVMKKKNP